MGLTSTQLILLAASAFVLHKIYVRLTLSRAKHPSLRGHAKWSRRIAKFIPYVEYDKERFLNSDDAPVSIVQQRRAALSRLKAALQSRSPVTSSYYESLKNDISDVQFTSAYKVPYPYRRHLDEIFKTGSMVTATDGVCIRDMDGNWSYDVAGSYGVNIFGYGFYKTCMAQGFDMAKNIGPVLGPYHPIIRENARKLKAISGLDEVSFHMSGTEAVMQAVRLARYHTGKTHLVRLCGAYHGWWDGVQPGIGNHRKADDVYTLSDLSDATLKVLETRNDIACLLINPLQALHPNADAPSDASLINSERSASFDRERYTAWLKKLRDVCTRRDIVLIFDEVFVGFRLGYRGAQEYFGIQADIVTYGKSLGGGLPVGVVCGRHDLMKRYQDKRPLDISFARGTFNSHPYVMCCMNVFLNRIEEDAVQQIYATADTTWNRRVKEVNSHLASHELPVRIRNMHSILTINYTVPSRYNWMFQFYLRNEGLDLSWIGTGRMIMSLNYTDEDFSIITDALIRAAEMMRTDGWWWHDEKLTNKAIKRALLKDMLNAYLPVFGKKPVIPDYENTNKPVEEDLQ